MKRIAKVAAVVAAFPFFYVYARATRHIPLSFLRFRNGSIQTPVVHFKHKETGRELLFVGTMHVGEKEYYGEVLRIINERPSYKVLYETVRPMSEEDKDSLNEKERNVLRLIGSFKKFQKELCRCLSIVDQSSMIPTKDSWVNSDISMRELIYLLAKHDVKLGVDESKIDWFFENGNQARWVLAGALRNIVPLGIIVGLASLIIPSFRIENEIILNFRNDIAIEHIRRIANDDIVLTWGAAHLPGIANGLKTLGYREVKKEWLSAYKDRKYFLRACEQKT